MASTLFISDSVIMGIFAFYAIKGFFGDGPLGRILAVLGFIVSTVFYMCLLGWVNQQRHMPFYITEIIFFGPISCTLLLALLRYAFGGSQQK